MHRQNETNENVMTDSGKEISNTEQDNDEKRQNRFNKSESDPGFLVAKGRFNGELEEQKVAEKIHVKKLANAIFMALQNHGYADVRAVGRNATYNAVKALTIASGYCKPKNVDLVFQSSFDEGNLGVLRNKTHIQNVTAMLFSVKDWKRWHEDK